ncbi:MAG: hypothetical protein RMK20_11110 [Verrucomicrobiales bacterium]|nr:hypothetical protein [Verrucomicrobiales bacterium]
MKPSPTRCIVVFPLEGRVGLSRTRKFGGNPPPLMSNTSISVWKL